MNDIDREVTKGMSDVRKALWDAYWCASQAEYGIEGKMSEGWCELQYPTWWDCDTEDEFHVPCGIMIYSYALGPSRTHYIIRGEKDREIDYYKWESPDIYAKAVEIINQWRSEYEEGE